MVKKVERNYVDGKVFKGMLNFGLNKLKSDLDRINDLNVFPIPDGDTGDNMYSTIYGGVKAIKDIEEENLSKVGELVGNGMLLSARGNSGVILSQMFAGITGYFKDKDKVSVNEFALAFEKGVETAYHAVSKPVEGTMLTVIREASSGALKNSNGSLEGYLLSYLENANNSLENTPNLLFALKEAGVIDSGGAGIILIIEGFLSFVRGEEIIDEVAVTKDEKVEIDFSLFTEDSEMIFGYCTEFLLQLTKKKTDVEKFSLDIIKEKLEEFGDSVVAVKNGSVVKVHVHTMNPGEVLSYAQNFGEFLTLKVENMTLQHSGTDKKTKKQEFKKNLVRKSYALVTVANGEGLMGVFKELGADLVIDGGQGNNPSVEVFLKAFDAVNADNIFVLPNNNNIIMAATEAGARYKESNVTVIPTKTLGDGYAVLSDLDYSLGDVKEIESVMLEAINCAKCLMVSKANRDALLNGVQVECGSYIGFSDKTVVCCEKQKINALKELINKESLSDYAFIVVFYGQGVTEEEKNQFENYVNGELKSLEFYEIDGGQEIYDFVIVLE